MSLLACVAGALAILAASEPAAALDRHLERPSAQANLGAHGSETVSSIQRQVTLGADGRLEFDFFVDSEPGKDFLRLSVDGVSQWEASGFQQAGRGFVPLAAGAHTLELAYVKDADHDEGLDTAWIDSVKVYEGATDHVVEVHAFDERLLGAPPGWQPGGYGGGWSITQKKRPMSLRRPAAGAFTGYQPVPVRTSIERTFTWPAASSKNLIQLSYFVDSEEGHDFLKVYVDGVVAFSASGRNRVGVERISVSSGDHVIKLEYYKDESVDEGLDDARILDFRAISEGGLVQLDGASRSAVGSTPDGWAPSSDATHGSWVVAGHRAPRVYAVQSAAPVDPIVDGEILGSSYVGASKVDLPDFAGTAEPGELWLQTSSAGVLFLGAQIPGLQDGEVTLLFDMNHGDTRSGIGCGPRGVSPGPEDRKLVLEYGSGSATLTEQLRGTCGAGTDWEAVPASSAWTASAASGQPQDDPGFTHLELSVSAPGWNGTSAFGLGLRISAAPSLLRLPPHDDWMPLEDDVSSWETITYEPLLANQASGVRVDGFARP